MVRPTASEGNKDIGIAFALAVSSQSRIHHPPIPHIFLLFLHICTVRGRVLELYRSRRFGGRVTGDKTRANARAHNHVA